MHLEYEPLGEEISVESSLVQAAQAVDIAGIIATESRNVEQLLQIGETWTKLADFIMAVSDARGKKELDRSSGFPTGFQAASSQGDDFEVIAEEDEDVRTEQDDC